MEETKILNRIALLETRGADNGAIIRKLKRRLRKLRESNTTE